MEAEGPSGTEPGTRLPGSVHEAIIERSGTGVVVLDRELRYTAANSVAVETNGFSAQEHIGRHLREVVPDVAPELEPVLTQVFRTGKAVTDIEVVGSVAPTSGRTRYWNVSVVPLPGDEDHLAVVFVDITGQRSGDQRLRDVMNSLFAFVGLLDTAGHVLEANEAALVAGGLVADEVIGRRFWDTPWWSWNEGVQQRLRDAVDRAAKGEPSRYDELVQLRGGRLTPIDFQLAPMYDGDRVVGLVPSGIDITSRVDATTRLEALARLSGTLAGCTTTDEVLAAAVEHPAAVEDAESLTIAVAGLEGAVRFSSTGGPLTELRSTPTPIPIPQDVDTALRCMDEAQPVDPDEPVAPVESVPLCDEAGEAIGALVIRWSEKPEPDPSARARIALVADLCSQALVRAARVDELHRLVTAVGRQVLEQEVDRPQLDVAIRYEPSTEMARFGGDWFDIVEVTGSRTAVVLGDVAGHGAAAAGTMAQLKGLVRGLILSARPGELFELATRGVAGPDPEMVATAAVAIVDTAANSVEVVRAGHPPPLLWRAGGSVRRLDGVTRPPIGIPVPTEGERPPEVLEVDFGPGDSLVLFSDGLVETRARPLDCGIEELEALLAGLPGDTTAGHTADAVLASLVQGEAEDDVALLVVRFRETD
jgi:PAS domain S-box-containing protein